MKKIDTPRQQTELQDREDRKISREQFMEFFRSDDYYKQLSTEDTLEVFCKALKGASDMSIELFNEILRDYSAGFEVQIKEVESIKLLVAFGEELSDLIANEAEGEEIIEYLENSNGEIVEYNFNTIQEKESFIKGMQAMQGYFGHNIITQTEKHYELLNSYKSYNL